jgi:uncharacterized membrane protein
MRSIAASLCAALLTALAANPAHAAEPAARQHGEDFDALYGAKERGRNRVEVAP